MMLRSLILILAILPTFAAENIKAVGAVSKANIKAIGAVAEANIKAFGVVDNTASGGGGGGPITPDANSVNVNVDDVTEDPETFTITIGNLTNGYITVFISSWPVGPTAATFDSTGSANAMTKIADNTVGSDIVDIWGVAVGTKAAGTYTISLDFAAAGNEITCGAKAWNNVHQTVSVGTQADANGTSATPGVAVTASAGDYSIAALHTFNESTITPNDTSLFQDITGATQGAAAYQTGANPTIDWTLGASRTWNVTGIALKPANP